MIVNPEHVVKGLNVNTSGPNVQDLPALCGYLLLRGYSWADSTSVGEAMGEIGTGEDLHPILGPVLARCLQNRARIDGLGWTVADVSRVRWWQRRSEVWERTIERSTGVAWPGDQGWADLRLSHLRADGWTCGEIASLVGIPVRSIRTRARRVGGSLRWAAVCPSPALLPGE